MRLRKICKKCRPGKCRGDLKNKGEGLVRGDYSQEISKKRISRLPSRKRKRGEGCRRIYGEASSRGGDSRVPPGIQSIRGTPVTGEWNLFPQPIFGECLPDRNTIPGGRGRSLLPESQRDGNLFPAFVNRRKGTCAETGRGMWGCLLGKWGRCPQNTFELKSSRAKH